MTFKPTKFMDVVEKRIQARKRLIVQYIITGVSFRSPVDTGAFRANWKISEGSPDLSFDDRKTNASPPDLSGITAYGVTHISNAAPYAKRLEDGHSQQAPLGMVALTMASIPRKYFGSL